MDSGLAVEFGIEAALEEADREGALLEDLAGPLHAFRLQPLDGNHGVDQAHFERLVGVILAAEEPDLAGFLLADHAGEVAGTEAAIETAHLGPDLAEDCVIGREAEVADHVQHVTAADRVTGDQCDDDLGHRADEFLQVEDVQPRHPGLINIAGVAAHALVAARAERVLTIPVGAGARQEYHPNGWVFPGVGEGVVHLLDGQRTERVPLFRPVDRNAGDALGLMVKDVGVRLGDLPVWAHLGTVGAFRPVVHGGRGFRG